MVDSETEVTTDLLDQWRAFKRYLHERGQRMVPGFGVTTHVIDPEAVADDIANGIDPGFTEEAYEIWKRMGLVADFLRLDEDAYTPMKFITINTRCLQ